MFPGQHEGGSYLDPLATQLLRVSGRVDVDPGLEIYMDRAHVSVA